MSAIVDCWVYYNFLVAIDKKHRAPLSENDQSEGLTCDSGEFKFTPQLSSSQFRTYRTVVYEQIRIQLES